MSNRTPTHLNPTLILILLINLVPVPRPAFGVSGFGRAQSSPQSNAQAALAPAAALARPATASLATTVWLPPARPVDGAPRASTPPDAPASALPGWFAAPDAGEQLAPPARPAQAALASPWPPSSYSSFVWAATDNAGAWYWDEENDWQQRSGGDLGTDAQVNDIAVSPFDHDVVLAATDDGIYLTTTASSWVSVTLSSNISDAQWNALRWDTHRPGVVFATGVNLTGPQYYPERPVWARSTDNGRTWTGGELYEGDDSSWEVHIDGGSDVWGAGDVWYIGSLLSSGNGEKLKRYWRTQDGGKTWQTDLIDVDESEWRNQSKWLAGRPADPSRVYVAPYLGPGYQIPLAHTYDGGDSWNTGGVPGPHVRHLEYDRTRPGTLWAAYTDGVIRSTDDGESFTTTYDAPNTLEALTIDGYTGRIYAGGPAGGSFDDFVYWDEGETSWTEPGGMPSPANDNTHIKALSAPQPPYLPGEMLWNPECPFCTAYEAVNHGGDPVDTRDGSFTHNQPGFGLPVLGGGLDFRLTYVSQATGTYTTTLGYGWTHNQAVRLSFPYGISGPLELQGHGGSRLVFGNNGDPSAGSGQAFSPFPGLRAELTRLGTAGAYTYVVTATTQAVYTFDDDGQLLTSRDPQGNVTTFEHQDGQLSRVIGPSSDPDQQRVLDFSYDGQDRLIRVTGSLSGSTALSYTVGMAYDGNGDLATFTDTRGLAWSYTYAGGSHLLTRVTDPNDHDLMQNSYDGRGRVTQQLDPLGNALHFGYTLSNTTLLTDSLGRVTVDAYDGRGTWVGSVYSNGETIMRSYDGNFNLGQTTDALGHETAYDWSDGGYDLEKVTDAAGQVTGFDYDARHNLTRSVNARGYTTTYEYDAHNNLVAITDTLGGVVANTYDVYGNLLSTTDQRGASTSYAYDAFGQRTAITDALGSITRFEYDALGRLITSTDYAPTGRLTLYAYDLGDNLIRSTQNYTSATTTQNYQGLWNLVTAYGYDGAGNRTLITNTQSQITKYAYDAANRLISTTHNYTSAGGIDYGATYNLVTRYGYDALGNQVVVTDTAPAFGDLITGSRVTRTFYDDLDRPIKTVLNYADGVYDPGRSDEDVVTLYEYDAAGNLITTTDTLGRVTLNTYDMLNRLVKTTLNYTTTTPNPDPATYNLVTTYAYDAVGNVVTSTDYALRFTLYEYDALNRLVKTTANYTTAGGQNYLNQYNLVTRQAYDAAGNRTLITNTQSLITKYQYDALGRLVTTTANYTSTPGADPNTYNLTTVYKYDARGNRTRIANSESRITNYEYDVLDRLVEMEDAEGSVTSYAYDVLGNVTLITNPQSLITKYAYDALGRLLTTTDALSGTTITAYDPYGDPIRQTDARGGIVGGEYDRLERPRRQVALEGLDGTPLAQDTFEDASAWTVVTGTWTIENGTYRQSDLGHADTEGLVSLYSGLTVSDFVAFVDLKFEATDEAYAVAGLIFRRSADGDESTMVGVRLANAGEWQSGVWSNPDGGLGGPYSTTYRIQGGASLYVEAGTWHRVGVVARDETVILLLDGAPLASWDGDPRESGNVGLITFHSDVRFDNFEVRPLDGYQETAFGYDGLGNRVQMGKWANGQIRNTQYAYDGLNRLVAVTDPLSHTTRYAYDALGNRVVMTDAEGVVTRYEYDVAGRLAAVVENHQTSQPTNAQTNVRTAYGYDALGHRTLVTDALGHTTVYTYDALGRLAAERDPLGQRTQYAYDALSQRTALTQALGTANQTAIGYDYDDVGRLLEITYPDPSTGSGQAVAYQYDAVGNRTAMTDTLGSTTYSYDALDRLTQVSDPYGEVVSYTYDAIGARTGLVYPDGKTVTYTYDALNRLIRVEDWDQGTTRYGYDESGRLVTATLPNGVRTAYAYDAADRLTQIEHRDTQGNLLARYAYELDAVGNRTHVTETQALAGEGGTAALEDGTALAALPTGLSAEQVIERVVGERTPGLAREAENNTTPSPEHTEYPIPSLVAESSERHTQYQPVTVTQLLTEDLPIDWWAAVQEGIRRSEYDVTWQDQTYLPDLDAAYQAPNRAHNLRTYFTPAGIRVIPRTSPPMRGNRAGDWELGVSLSGYGYRGDVHPLASGELTATGNRLENPRPVGGVEPGLVEWYVNDERGVEQGFTLSQRPVLSQVEGPLVLSQVEGSTIRDQASEIVLSLSLSGNLSAALSDDGQAVEFITPGGVRVLRYGELHAYDATGRELPARLEPYPLAPGEVVTVPCAPQAPVVTNTLALTVTGCTPLQVELPAPIEGLRLIVDDSDAVYPITVDPLLSSPGWTAESDQVSANFGYAVGTAGDVNGDGYSDVVVGAHAYDNGQTDEGRAYVFHGSATGPSTTADWTAESDQAGALFGLSVGTAGDVNGDGYSDVIVGAGQYSNGQTKEGRAYVFYGSAAGLSTTAAWTTESNQASAYLGYAVGTAGDVNGDGYSDVIVGAHGYNSGLTWGQGKVYVFLGSAAGLSSSADWSAAGEQGSSYFGLSAGTAGDVNGDGYADVVVGAYRYDGGQTDEGRAYVYHGSATGLSSSADWTAESDQTAAYFGRWVGAAGDVNGDGYSDAVVGAHGYDGGQTDEGRTYVFHGSAAGLSSSADWTAESDQASAYFGCSAITAGDVNGDGYADLIVGAYYYDGGQTNEGRAYVYHGSSSGLGTGAADWTAESDQTAAGLGLSVGTAGDVNGDGYSDVIVGAYAYDNGQTDEGRAYVFHGASSGLSTGAADWTAESDQANASFGCSAHTAGDVNGDGYADVVVGAYLYDNGQADEGRAYVFHGSATGPDSTADWTAESDQAEARLGYAVGAAGDVNGDGYGDVVVGAYLYDNGQSDEGRAYVFHGSASGLNTGTADWTAESNQGSANFGYAVGTAGDVNGDGYGDVIVGAHNYDDGQTNEGRAYVFHGGASGLNTGAADWTAESDQTGALFGLSVGTAGDVNGDGYSDVIVGAGYYSDDQTREGGAYVYHGGASGLNTGAADWMTKGNQAYVYLGYSVGTAGDVNGDGYSDVIVGAHGYSSGLGWGQGRAYVYHGSSSGLITGTADWTAAGEQSGSYFGLPVGTAGDVNGDGYSDVVVGANRYDGGQSDEGRAYVYHGSPAGLNGSADWTAESDQESAYFGRGVGAAGDVNGDGYGDVVVGAPSYDGGQLNEGRVFLYYGNGGDGLDLRPRQMRAGGLTPIAPLGASTTTLQLHLTGRSPMGRAPVKLQWQVASLGTPFTASAIISGSSAAWTDVLTTGALITQSVSGLAADTPYHWRARLLYHPGNRLGQSAGRWVHAPWNGWAEADLRALQPLAGLSAVNDSPTGLGQVTTLTATLTAGSHPLYEWALGDGATASGLVVTHTYPGAGTYTAVVTASNAVSALTTTTPVTIYVASAPELVTTTITYTYDSLYRLTEADYSSGENFQYAYDAAGNRTVYTATLGGTQVTTYTYDAGDRLVKVGDVAYTWNALGQLTRDGIYTYTWDAAGRLITVTDGITTLGFLYDGDGNRLARIVNGTLTTHTLDVGLGLPEVIVEHDNGQVTRYLHLPTGVATDDGVWTYSTSDGLGSVRQRLDASGQVAAVNGYRPFGLVLSSVEGSPLDGGGGDPYGFTGEWWEDDAGLLFLRARYYDPATGRFLSQDTWQGDVWQPQTLNGFVYADNNPLRFVDPGGNQSCNCDELWEELRSKKCQSNNKRALWDWYFEMHRQKYLEWAYLYRKEALAAAQRHNLPELMGISANEAAARMFAYKWINFTAGYLQDVPEAMYFPIREEIRSLLGREPKSRSMTVFEYRPEEIDALRQGRIRFLNKFQAPFGLGAEEWEWAFARPKRRMMASEFLLSHPKPEELIELAATQMAHGAYAYQVKWDEYRQYATDAVLKGKKVSPIPWPLLSMDNFLLNWASSGNKADMPKGPGEPEGSKIKDRWAFLADRPSHMAYILPGLFQIFEVESDCPCGDLWPYDAEADREEPGVGRMPQVRMAYGPSFQPLLYLPVPLKQH